MSHETSGIEGYPAFRESLNTFNTESGANIRGTQDRTEEIFRQERAHLAQQAAQFEAQQQQERAAFQHQQAAQEASQRANTQQFDAKVDAYHGELQKLDDRHNKQIADRRAKFQAEMRERESALDARIQAHRATHAATSHQSALRPTVPYEVPTFSPNAYNPSTGNSSGLAPLPSLSGGGLMQPPAPIQPMPPMGGGMAALPELAPLPPLGGQPPPASF